MIAIFTTKLVPLYNFIVAAITMTAMHVLSTLIGSVFPLLLSKFITEILIVILFVGYGVYTTYDAIKGEDEDLEEEARELKKQYIEKNETTAEAAPGEQQEDAPKEDKKPENEEGLLPKKQEVQRN